ncbi:GOLPH3/VPS74 family protein [Rhodococcoides corynebacterioides]|uniref:GOLPH3/VPS74 family protein n=1 Tax=Rhodococcoides corynebacterioides TaxID=53972 RepID=UPI003AEC87B5
MTLIAEDLLLLLLDDGSGKPVVDSTKLPRAVAGAVILELAMSGVVTVAQDGEDVKKGRLAVRGPRPDEPILQEAVAAIDGAKRPMTPKSAVEKLHKAMHEKVLARVIDRGFVDEQKGRVLGLFPTTSWPARDTAHEARVRETLQWVLVDGRDPDARTCALVALLSSIDAVPKVFPGADKRSIKKRAAEIAEGQWASEAVRRAVEDVWSAVAVAVMVPTIVTTSS